MPENKNINKGVGLRKGKKESIPKGTNYILVIGIDDYAHCPRLHNAVKDAKDIVQVLKRRFQFEEANIFELYDKEATKRNIYDALSSMASRVTNIDNFLLYFSGHGEYHKVFELGYWIPVEAEEDAVDQYVPNSEIRNILGAIKSHHTFLMIDSCFSGSLFAETGGRNVSLRKERDPSRWGLTAGRNEIVTDGEQGTNSPFAKSILYQLENTNQPIGVAELCDNVLEVVSANAEQTPRGEPLKVGGHQGGQFVFHLKKDELTDWKETIAIGTIQGYQDFVEKYPDGQHTVEANSKINLLKAEELWQKIEKAEEGTVHQIKEKLKLVNQYVNQHADQIHYNETLDLGLLLEYKKQYIPVKNSKLGLLKFIQVHMPSVAGAKAIQEEARTLLATLNEAEIEASEEVKAKVADRERKAKEEQKAEEQKAKQEKEEEEKREAKRLEQKKEQERREKQKREKEIAAQKKKQEQQAAKIEPQAVSQPSAPAPKKTEPSFLKKYGKYMVLVVLTPFLIWGGTKLMPRIGSSTTDNLELKPYEDATTKLWGYKRGTLIVIPAKYESVKEFKNNVAQVSKAGHQFIIDEKGTCIRNCKTENNGSIGTSTPLQDYQDLIAKGNEALSQKPSNIATAKRYFLKAFEFGKVNKLSNRDAEVGLKNCKKLELRLKPAKIGDTGTLIDSRDGQSYKWKIMKDGNKWMIQSLNYKSADSWCYNNEDSNCRKYGRLYTWEAAKKACPEEWRLPTLKESKHLQKVYGGRGNAYKALIDGGSSSFSAKLSGRRDGGSYMGLGRSNAFWTSIEASKSQTWFFNFHKGLKVINLNGDSKTNGYSCRCIENLSGEYFPKIQ